MIIGHERNQQYLLRAMNAGVLAHTYLFGGPAAVGKKTFALAVAEHLLCENPVPTRISGCSPDPADGEARSVCASCRLVRAGTHPDVVFLSREARLAADAGQRDLSAGQAGLPAAAPKESSARTNLRSDGFGRGRSEGIGIEDIRELRERVSRTPWSGKRIIAIIDGVEALSRDAAVALLKTLEEPGADVVFFLITDAAGAVLPTIRSRAVPLHFAFVRDADLAPLLAGVPAARRGEYLTLASGRPGVLVRMREDDGYRAAEKARREEFERLHRTGLAGHFAFADQGAKEPGRLEAYLSFLLERGHAALPTARPGEIARIGAILRSALRTLAFLEGTPANRRLLADAFFFELSGFNVPPR
ncbi:MAG: hypothetical protein A3A44_02595 [Candidatus Sungbacteria bacterium RIFCSPLOWO2_01_FULL_60_25]|uniref:DNA polymerase III subunit delta n=1 Tax=Candidatus Sungbacteria bacterium RIFCSPLOWO2_01_FULL_60_25 TaxID=1802281 RepID=A0A1G2LCT6_9BACT|nr:MAG: hypothetical protein A3A44_02595 [Candidatus Sungbacteria bacterium RIFCSPLOWO2_01_FULL_60_25]